MRTSFTDLWTKCMEKVSTILTKKVVPLGCRNIHLYKHMKKIGITGGIGSGKSFVCRVFQQLGVPVYQADERAKWLTEHDPMLRADIIRLLGREAYDLAGRYNRAFVAAQVFGNPDRLVALNALIHPRVWIPCCCRRRVMSRWRIAGAGHCLLRTFYKT